MNEPVNLVFKKEIDYSIFYQGTTIAREYHPLIDRAIKNHLDLGESIDIKLLFDSNEFTARIRNAKRDVNGDSYQLRYDSNTELISRIQNKFPDVSDV